MTKLEAIQQLLTGMASIDMGAIGDRETSVAFDALWNRLCAQRLQTSAIVAPPSLAAQWLDNVASIVDWCECEAVDHVESLAMWRTPSRRMVRP